MDPLTHEIDIRRYSPADAELWNSFVASSRNATFLHDRRYMDYHADRFADHSLIALNKGRLLSLLPANETPGTLHSHQGLTYGGWLLPEKGYDPSLLLPLFEATRRYAHNNGFNRLDYKPIPYIYHRRPSQDDLYALWRLGAVQSVSHLSSAIDLREPPRFNTLQRRHLKKALQAGVTISETRDCAPFHEMLSDCLRERHDCKPVHTLAEMQTLMASFPENIRLFTARTPDGEICGGTLIYDTGIVAHSQYIATTAPGRANGALSLLFHTLITQTFASRRYFDFGTSNEEGGSILNVGLAMQKSALGGSGVIYPAYSWKLDG